MPTSRIDYCLQIYNKFTIMSLMLLSRVSCSMVRTLTTSSRVLAADKGCGISEKQAEILKQKTPIGDTFFFEKIL